MSRHTHPGRQVLTSRWKIKIYMTAVNPTIKRLKVVLQKNFKKGTLDGVVEVQRVGSGMKVNWPSPLPLPCSSLPGTPRLPPS